MSVILMYAAGVALIAAAALIDGWLQRLYIVKLEADIVDLKRECDCLNPWLAEAYRDADRLRAAARRNPA